MARELRGVAAAPGVAIAAPWIHDTSASASGVRRSLDHASAAAAAELEGLAQRLRADDAAEPAEILEAQALMAIDEELLGPAQRAVEAGAEPQEAIRAAAEDLAQVFEAMDDELLAARAADVRDVAGRIARHVLGAAAPRLERRSVAVAVDLAPSVTVEVGSPGTELEFAL